MKSIKPIGTGQRSHCECGHLPAEIRCNDNIILLCSGCWLLLYCELNGHRVDIEKIEKNPVNTGQGKFYSFLNGKLVLDDSAKSIL